MATVNVGVDGGRPCKFLFRELFAPALHDQFLTEFCTITQDGFLEIDGYLAVLQKAAGSVHFDHGLTAEIVGLGFGRLPLSMEVLACDVVSCVVEIATKRAPGRPPPMASLGAHDDGYRAARRPVGQHLGCCVDGGWFTGVPRLLLGFGPWRVGGSLDQIVYPQPFLSATKEREGVCARHGVHRVVPSTSLVSNHRLWLAYASSKEGEHFVPVFIRLGEHQCDVGQNTFSVVVAVGNRR